MITHVVVGGPGSVVAYNPPSVVRPQFYKRLSTFLTRIYILQTAAVGDTVTFTFQQKNHTITESSLENPCSPLAGGFDSGFQPVAADDTSGPFPSATITVCSITPTWIYCRQMVPASHCAAGMVFAINPGSGQLAAFQAAARATGNSGNATATSAAYPGYTSPMAASLPRQRPLPL